VQAAYIWHISAVAVQHFTIPTSVPNRQWSAPMINNFTDIQKLSQTNLDQAMKVFGEWNKNWQAIAAEMNDYTKRSFEDGTATFEKLVSAKSLEQAIEIQTSYAKRAYDEYMQQMSKIGGMYTSLAKEAYKPAEKLLQNIR
jgi:hypothetical protein